MQADLILYALVAAGLVFWLRSVLGTRHGEERERPNPFATSEANAQQPESRMPEDDIVAGLELAKPALPRNVSIADEGVEQKLVDLLRHDGGFDAGRFAQGAQDAFVMIVEAFAAGDRETLKDLLEPSVYNSFDGAIAQREAAGENISTEIHAIRKVEIMDARVDSRAMYVTVRFIADETCVVRNREGSVLSGDPERITEMNDIWTFSRPLRTRDPRWFLHETRDGDVSEQHKTPVPDSQ